MSQPTIETIIADLKATNNKLLEVLRFASRELHQHVDYGKSNCSVTYAADAIDMAIVEAKDC